MLQSHLCAFALCWNLPVQAFVHIHLKAFVAVLRHKEEVEAQQDKQTESGFQLSC